MRGGLIERRVKQPGETMEYALIALAGFWIACHYLFKD